MRYLGGKQRIAKHIAKVINSYEFVNYYEPFCGMASVAEHVVSDNKQLSDINLDLIILWQALQTGWTPPTSITESEYQQLKDDPDQSALRSFVGFGCSFSGKWFGGMARDNTGRNYCSNAKNSILKKLVNLESAEFSCKDFWQISPEKDSLIYCDPPYKGTTKYATNDLDYEMFWQWVRDMSLNHTVLVSEYTAPDDFLPIWEMPVKTDMRGGKGNSKRLDRVEKLFAKRG